MIPSLRRPSGFRRDDSGVAAIEFALLAMPFFVLLLGTIQVGVWYYAQSALNGGVLKSAQTLYSSFRTGATPVLMTASALKANVASKAGGMISNDSTLAVELQPIAALSSASVPITDGVLNYGTNTSTLVIRARSKVISFIPGLNGALYVTSTALVRRQGT